MKSIALLLVCLLCVAEIAFGASPDKEKVRFQSVQADFVQEKHLKILTRPIVSMGTFTFQSPQSLRWEYRTPIQSLLLMHGSTIKKFLERDGQLTEERGARFDFMQFVLTEISNWLDGRFTDNDMFQVTFPGEYRVILTPKKEMATGLISKIELTLADKKGLLDSVKIFEDSESYTKISFKNRVLNQDLPPSLFTKK